MNKLAKIRYIITDYYWRDYNFKGDSAPPPPIEGNYLTKARGGGLSAPKPSTNENTPASSTTCEWKLVNTTWSNKYPTAGGTA